MREREPEHGRAAQREYVQQAEDARGVSLLGRMRGDDRPAIAPAETPAPGELDPPGGTPDDA